MKILHVLGIFICLLLILTVAGCTSSKIDTQESVPKEKTTSISSPTIPPVDMITNKTQYVHGETVKLKVTNNLDIPIWYIGYQQSDLVFWELERAQSDGWQGVTFRLPLIEGGRKACRLIMYEQPIGVVTELKPHSDLTYEWDQNICSFKTVTEQSEPESIERGKYRFLFRYSLVTVNSENIDNEPWKRPIDLGETKIIYSNEFVLE